MKWREKLKPLISMKTMATASTAGLLKYAKLASCVAMPERLTVVIMCMMASSHSMPARW